MSAPRVLGFLHTARPNVEMFRALVESIDSSVPTRHDLLESVLQDAVGTGRVTDGMRRQTEAAIRDLVDTGASVVVCTCSTIGGIAEAVNVGDVPVMRIDRPMAEEAVASGRRIIVAATLRSTIRPTIDLIQQVAADAAREIDVVELLCGDAWPHFERGDRSAYARAITDAVVAAAHADDVVVLAQASMAPAAELIAKKNIRALASPELGVRAGIAAYRSRDSHSVLRNRIVR